MPDALTVDIAFAIATLVAPAAFLVLLAVAGWRRSRGLSVGAQWSALVTVVGGVCLGLFLVLPGDLLVTWPILGTVPVLWFALVRRGSWRLAYWLLAGVATPLPTFTCHFFVSVLGHVAGAWNPVALASRLGPRH